MTVGTDVGIAVFDDDQLAVAPQTTPGVTPPPPSDAAKTGCPKSPAISMPLFKLPFEANFPISTPLAGQVQPPTARSAAGHGGSHWRAGGGCRRSRFVAVLAGTVAVLPTGRRVTVVRLDEGRVCHHRGTAARTTAETNRLARADGIWRRDAVARSQLLVVPAVAEGDGEQRVTRLDDVLPGRYRRALGHAVVAVDHLARWCYWCSSNPPVSVPMASAITRSLKPDSSLRCRMTV